MGLFGFVLLLLYFTTLISAQLPKIIFGIEIAKMDDFYFRVLFEQTLAELAISNLCMRLSSVHIYLEIEKRLKIFQKMDKKGKMSKMIRTQFDKIFEEIERRSEAMDASDLCNFYEYFEKIESLTNGEKIMAKNGEKEANDRAGKEWVKSQECEMFNEEVARPKNVQRFIILVKNFNQFVSDCHFKYLDKILAESEVRKNLNFRQIFAAEKTAHESAVSHHFKTLSVQKEYDKMKRAKSILQNYLLDEQKMDEIERKHPILLSMGVRSDDFVKKLFCEIFAINNNENAVENKLFLHIKMSVSCMNVVAYFYEFDEKINLKNYKRIWKMFNEILEKLGKWPNAKNKSNLLETFYQFEMLFTNELGGQQKMMTFWTRKLLSDYERCLIELYEENEQFRSNFKEKSEIREMIKRFFLFAEIEEQNEPLFHELIKLFNENEKDISKKENELNKIKIELNANILQNEKRENESEEKSRKNKIGYSNSMNVDMVIVKTLYTKLMTELKNANEIKKGGKHFETFRKLEMNATLWHFKKAITLLFEFSDRLENKNANFIAKIEYFKNKWKILTKNNGNERSKELCTIYKLANEIVTDQTLIKRNSKWKLEIEKQMAKNEKLDNGEDRKYQQIDYVILLPKNGQIEWAKMNCENGQMGDEFLEEMRKSAQRMEIIHLFAITNLIVKSKGFSELIYKGTETIGIWRIKENLGMIVHSLGLLSIFETNFPHIFHYEILLDSQYISLFLGQLAVKNNSFTAQIFEARIMSPFLVKELQIYIDLLNDLNCEIRTIFKNELIKKIIEILNQFFESIKNDENLHFQRTIVCQLFLTTNFISEMIQRLSDKTLAKNVTAKRIGKWTPTECGTDSEIQKAFSIQKKRMQSIHFEYLRRILKDEIHVQWFNDINGAKAQIRRLLGGDDGIATEAKANQILAMFKTQKCFDNVFYNAPLAEFYEVALFDENAKRRSVNWLKVDIVLWVKCVEMKQKIIIEEEEEKQQMEDKVPNWPIFVQNFSAIWAVDKYAMFELYDRMFDTEAEKVGQRLKEFVILVKEFYEKIAELLRAEENLEQTADNEHGNDLRGGKSIELCEMIDLRFEMLKKAIVLNEKLKINLLKGLATENLIKIFGKEKTNEILRICQKESESEATKNVYENWKEEKTSEEKEKRIKRKNSKKKKTNRKMKNGEKIEKQKEEKDTEKDENKNNKKEEKEEEKVINNNKSRNGQMSTDLSSEEEEKEEKEENETKTNGSEIEQKSGENGEEHLAEEAAAEDKLDLNELIGLKIGHFWEDNLLNLKYGELFWEVSKDNYWAQNVTVKTLSWTLHFGVYANEISHRIGILGDEISEELEIISKNEKWEIEKQWEKLKTVELSDQIMRQSERSKLMAKLHLLLKKIVAKMDDGFWGENGTNLWEEIGQIKSQLHSRKLAKAMAGSETERQTMPHLDKVILALIQTANNGPNEDKMPKHRAEFEEQLRAAKQFNEQRKLDKKLFKQLTEEANLTKFVEEKEWEKFRLKKLAKFPEEWQEIKYEENAIENEEKTKQIKDFINQNYSTDEKIKENKWKKANEELEKIIGEWSSDVRIQFSSLSHLKIQLEQMDAICLFPHGFDQRNIFGRFCCDNLDKKEEKCLDQSLNCTLCMHSNVNSLQKITKTQKHLIPRMTFKFMDLLFEVKFVIMPNIGQLPPGKYSWKEFEQFETEIGNKIEQLIKNDQFDMGMCKYDLKDRAKMREELVKKMANSADSNRLNYSENIEKLDEICNFLIKQKKMAIKNRKFVNELNAMLQTLAEFTFYAKIYEEFLNETEKQKEGTKADKFSQILAYLELWAKNNQIFDDSMGYLNTKMLLIMLTKLFIFYPNASMPFLVDKFFLTFSTWNWPLPVQLAEINYGREDGFLSWSPFREWVAKRQATDQHLRAVFRQQLTMPTITPTFPEQNFGANLNGATAKVILNELKIAFKQIKSNKNLTEIILPMKEFTEKFSHFVLVRCSGHQLNIDRFSKFVMGRIRYELQEFIQNSPILSKRVDLFHVNPTECKTEQTFDQFDRPSVKKSLLVGLKFFSAKTIIKNKIRNELNEVLRKMDEKMKNDFNFSLFYNVSLSSKYIERAEIPSLNC